MSSGRLRTPGPAAGAGVVLVLAGLACGDAQRLPCEEPPGASAELDRVDLSVRTTEVSAEIYVVGQAADEDRPPWAGRRCELEALLWVPEQVGPAEVTLCELVVAVDLAFVREGEVVAVERDLPPCDAPCEACPVYGERGPAVDAVLWFSAGSVDVVEGDGITGLEAVALPMP